MKTTKEELTDKALELFREFGYENVSINKICKECHVTRGSFYHHYKAKGDILLEFHRKDYENTLFIMKNLIMVDSPIEQLWKFFEASIDRSNMYLGADTLKHAIIQDMSLENRYITPYAVNRDELNDYTEMLYAIIVRGQRLGEIRKDADPKDMVFTVIAGIIGVSIAWSASKGNFDRKAEVRRIFETVFFGGNELMKGDGGKVMEARNPIEDSCDN